MALKCFALCISLNFLLTAGQDNIDQLIDEVYGSSSTTESGHSHGEDVQSVDKGHTNCECVPYYQCNDKNHTFNTDGVDLIDIRIKDGPCESYLDICCSVNAVDHTTGNGGNGGNNGENGGNNGENGGNNSENGGNNGENGGDQGQHPEPTSRPTHHYERMGGCGHRNEEGVGFRITGALNNEAQFGEFPWMVAILKEEECNCNTSHKLNVYQCGGSLIHPQVVLTAAHCVHQKNPAELKIRAGEWDTQTKNELYPHHDRRVHELIIHDQYYAGALHNDVALLILDSPLEYKENIDVTCLPHQDEIFDESECFATGWGKDVFGKEGKYQVILKKVQLPTVNRGHCQDSLRKTRLGPHFKLHESFICAGGERGKDTCKGDGGSPLVCPIRSKPGYYTQAGIVAWGIGCGEDGTPGVYVNVAKFRHWIDSKLDQLQYDTSAYNS